MLGAYLLKHAPERDSLPNFQNHKFLKLLSSLALEMYQTTLKIPKDPFIVLFSLTIYKISTWSLQKNQETHKNEYEEPSCSSPTRKEP